MVRNALLQTVILIWPIGCPWQVYELLARTVYGKRKRAEVGVARLLNEGAYTSAFPLHEVRDILNVPPLGLTPLVDWSIDCWSTEIS